MATRILFAVEDVMEHREIRDAVQKTYGELAAAVKSGARSCCGPSCCSTEDPISGNLYRKDQTAGLPQGAVDASLGCGNPTALAELHEGEVVLDLGSGGGIDVLLSARRVGPTGKVIGLDLTDEMLDLARDNQRRAAVHNVEFLKGDIQAIPLPDSSVDVIISNCVINLAPDKTQVLYEAFRVLKPGGRLAVSDVVVQGRVTPALRRDLEMWVGCIAGALEQGDYTNRLRAAGFEAVDIETWRVYDTVHPSTDAKFVSAFIRARKPRVSNDVGPEFSENV
jgi:arsenite methyltransferase